MDTPAPAHKLSIRRVPIRSIAEDPANARLHNERNLDAIVASLQRFGQAEPLVVNARSGRLVAGHGRLAAMRKLGWNEADVVDVDLAEIDAAALGIALNRTAELAEWDDGALGRIGAKLDQLEWPVTYVDFEFDPGVAVPRFEGCRPYDRIPFQWALAVQEAPETELGPQQDFLHMDETDPSRPFAEALLAAVPASGSLVAHHASAETTVIRRLAKRLGGELGARLDALIARFVDSETIASAGYYHPSQQGSWSIKKLAPALLGRGYEDLEINNGMAAVLAWRRALRANGPERERLGRELRAYCGRDAILMHGVLECLRRLSVGADPR